MGEHERAIEPQHDAGDEPHLDDRKRELPERRRLLDLPSYGMAGKVAGHRFEVMEQFRRATE